MQGRTFDAIARVFARNLPRRGFLRQTGAVVVAAGAIRAGSRAAVALEAGSVGLPCAPCNCAGDVCDCCLIGITGGGVVRTEGGDVNLVLFATQLADDAPQEAAGFVRWLDPNAEGGLVLESVGPIAYDWPEGNEFLRNVRGVMAVNGQGEQPFVLEVIDAGPDRPGEDSAKIAVGDKAGDGGSSGFGYEASGLLVGGDIQMLNSVAPVSSSG